MKDDPEDEDSGVWSSGSANESPSSSTYGSQRASRNMAEKQRRDNLNTQIQAMASLVPTVSSGGTRKKDKISVLRLATAHLRIDYTLGPATNSLLPAKFRDVNIEKHILDSMIGSSSFMLAITSTGKIVYISEHVEQYLGHEQSDLIGDSLYNYVYHDDHEELTRNLTVDESLLDFSSSDDSKEDTKTSSENDSSSSSSSSSRLKHISFKDQRRNFNIRMSQRANSRRENVHYEYLQVSGVLRIAKKCNHFLESSSTHSTQKESSTSNDVLFVGVARLLKKRTITELSLLEANKNEYFTRHLVDGRIIFCDHRISLVAGYMAEEVSGTSAFKFMYKDDVRWTIIALRHMYDQGKNYGSSCYRLETKTGEFIYLRTHGYLEYDETTQSVGSFICINTLTSKEEGERLNKEMKKRFSATISDTVKSIRGTDKIESTNDSEISSDSEKNTEDLSQLEDAITHLISDLPSPGISTEGPLPDAQFVKAAIYSQRLPPASLQASKIGIKEIENKWPCIGKGKNSAKKNSDESKSHKKNSEKNKNSSDKHISDMENSKSPLGQSKRKSVNEKEVCQKLESFSELRKSKGANKNIESSTNLNPSAMSSQFHIQNNVKDNYMDSELLAESLPQMNLKRSYKDVEELDMNKSSKKRASDNCVTVELISIDDQIYPNGNLDFQNYIPVKSLELENNLDVSDMYQLTNDQLDLDTTADPLLNFQDLQGDEIFSAGFDNSQDLMKLFSSLPQDINYDDDQSDLLQFANSDQSSVLENSIGRNHLELPHTMSSCESQFSDLESSIIQTRCDSFIQTKPEHKVQKQKLKPLQHSRHKMPVKVKHNIGV